MLYKLFQLTIMLTTRLLQHKAMIVASDGCYEYHMNHQDVQDHDGNLAALEVDHILYFVCLFIRTPFGNVGIFNGH